MTDLLNGFCKTDFWDLQFTWYADIPDFTQCFQNTLLIWLPFGFLLLFTPYEIYTQKKSREGHIPWNFYILKLIITLVLVIIEIVKLIWMLVYMDSAVDSSPATISSPIISLVGYALVGLLIVTGGKNGIQSSTVLFYFWLLQFLAVIISYYSKVIRLLTGPEVHDVTLLGLHLASTPLVLLQLLLTFIPDQLSGTKRHSIQNKCPEKSSSHFSRLLFGWMDSMVISGFKSPLTQNDLWNLDKMNQSKTIVADFDHYWDKQLDKAKKSGWVVTDKATTELKGVYHPSVLRALIKCFWPMFLFGTLQLLIADLLAFVNPIILDLVIGFVSSNEPLWKGIFFAIIVFVTSEVRSLLMTQCTFRMEVVALKARVSLVSAIYRKALKLSNQERMESTIGEIVNHMSIDADNFAEVMPYVSMLFSAPVQIVVALYMLSLKLGISVIAGVVVMVILGPVNAGIASVLEELQENIMEFKDERTKLISEILDGIKVLKLYAWESPFRSMVQAIRNKEIGVLKTSAYWIAGIEFLITCSSFMVSLASFAMFVLIDKRNVLTANIAFVTLSLFELLQTPLGIVPMLIIEFVHVSVSVKRLNKFLRGEELDPSIVTNNYLGDDAIVIEDATLAWGGKSEEPTLTDVNLKVPVGKLVAVVGQVGSGKSSLVSSMLGELNKRKGKINIQGSVAYVPQQAWIQNATIKDNILMFKECNQNSYDAILDACSLRPDLKILPGGDKTEIGEKGINLSGGQKQRVSLARAVYRNSDVYLLDDPLSAVDSHVGKHIFDEVIGPSGLLSSTTRIFVTNGISYLPVCDSVVVLKDGVISEMGTYQELLQSKGAFSDFLNQYLSQKAEELTDENVEQLDDIFSKISVSPNVQRQISKVTSESGSESGSVHSKPSGGPMRRRISSASSVLKFSRRNSEMTKLIQEETMETAEVKIDVYFAYFKHLGLSLSMIVLLLWMVSQAASIGSNVWLSLWSNDPVEADGTVDTSLRDMRLGVYGGLGVAEGFSLMLSSFGFAYATMRAAALLHNQMLDSVLKSPMSFFDTTPSGRIVNRFSKDVEIMDFELMMQLKEWIHNFFEIVSVIIVDAIKTPMILVALIPATIIYYFVQKVYIATSRQLKRLESVTNSPIYNHFKESIAGASSIRAYGVQDVFINESNKRVDANNKCHYPSIAVSGWLAVRLEFIGSLIVLFAVLFAVLSRDILDPGSVGLSVSYAMTITQSLNEMVHASSELETMIVSVERILEYSKLKPEADWDNDYNKSNPSWPEAGQISFNSYSTKYREELDTVLRDISCNIEPGEKIGICGRTGAGKSSLTLALFRIIEATGGSITIDNIDIAKLGLHNLRSRLTIIPQDPVLFSGTLRQNLDPCGTTDDEVIWSALEHAHLKTFTSGLAEGLDFAVAEGGENMSVGQRQLVCLARAILRKTKILILDEATAAVDLETDDLIQATIRKEFADSTIITIAHRLNTIMDSTRILVLDHGKVAEMDTPQNLLINKKSIFYGMAENAGLI